MTFPRTLAAGLLLVLAPVLPSSISAQTDRNEVHTPRFEEAPCPVVAGAELLDRLRCGYLVVPENREDPAGRQLRLAVGILVARSSTPRPDPLVYLSGGPGVGALRYLPRFARQPFWNQLGAERDLILFDQRGTGYSEPQFCPEVTDEFFQLTFSGLDARERLARQRAVLVRCGEAMRQEGVDLSRYNSLASAHDLQDLRRALGYEAWNLYGVSYGSRLALEAMRSAPEGIRSVTLDGPAPPHAPRHAERAVNFTDVLQRLAAVCAADARCDAAYPELERRFWETVEGLNERPLLIRGGDRAGLPDPIVFDGRLLAEGLFQALYAPEFLPLAPLFIQEVGRRNEDLILALAAPLSGGIRELSRGLNLAVECYESAPFNGPEVRLRVPDAELLDRIGFASGSLDVSSCDAWHPFRAGPEQGEPVGSDIPTLVFTGEFDPVTHRRYGPLAAQGLTTSRVVEVPGGGHVTMTRHECTRTMMLTFLDDPTGALDPGCVEASIPPLQFITDVRVARGISRLAATARPGGSRGDRAALGVPLLMLLSAVVGWPVAAGVGRIRRRERKPRSPLERGARWGAAAVALLTLAFVASLMGVITRTAVENPVVLLFGLPGWAAPLLVVPWILLAGSLALVAAAALAWRRTEWTRWGRIHFGLVAAASLVLAILLFAWGIV